MAGRPKIEVTDEAVLTIQHLSGFGLTVSQIATVLCISASTLKRWKQKPEVKEACDRGFAIAETNVAKSLYDRATKQQDLGAIIWWEKTRAKRTERDIQQEVDAQLEIELSHVLNIAKSCMEQEQYANFMQILAASK